MINTKRNYWITTHWPPEIDTQTDFSIYLYEGTQQVGVDIGPGDRVWIYQSNSGRRILRETPTGSTYKKNRQPGKGGVIALMEVVNELYDTVVISRKSMKMAVSDGGGGEQIQN